MELQPKPVKALRQPRQPLPKTTQVNTQNRSMEQTELTVVNQYREMDIYLGRIKHKHPLQQLQSVPIKTIAQKEM